MLANRRASARSGLAVKRYGRERRMSSTAGGCRAFSAGRSVSTGLVATNLQV